MWTYIRTNGVCTDHVEQKNRKNLFVWWGQKRLFAPFWLNSSYNDLRTDLLMVCKFKFVRYSLIASLQNSADGLAVWKDLSVMMFIALMHVWYKMAIITVWLK